MKKKYKSAKPFIKKLLKDQEIRIYYEEERTKTLISQAVKTTRLQAGFSQTELAKKAFTTQNVISRVEAGTDSRMPSLALLSRIAAACKAKMTFGFVLKKAA